MSQRERDCNNDRADQEGVDRRDVLRGIGLSFTALMSNATLMPGGWKKVMARPLPLEAAGGSCPRFGVFDGRIFAILEAVAEQIVPTDEDPGASDFCSASLVEATAAGDPGLAYLLEAGLSAIDESSHLLFARSFVDLLFAEQTFLLRKVEAGEAPGITWDDILSADHSRVAGQVPNELHGLLRTVDQALPSKHIFGSLAASDELGATAQRTVFATLRTLCKLAFVLNFPETTVRNADGTPIFSDPEHLISDPDDDATLTGWTVVGYHEIDYEVEKLMWEWQAGCRVVGFDGVPILDTSSPLSEGERLAARDTLYALSDRGLV